MRSVGVRELKERTSEILRRVRDQGEEVEITHHGRPVARLVPVTRARPSNEDLEAVWSELDRLAEEISAKWPDGISAVDAVREERRDL
jgi:prevent-host-death family protein